MGAPVLLVTGDTRWPLTAAAALAWLVAACRHPALRWAGPGMAALAAGQFASWAGAL